MLFGDKKKLDALEKRVSSLEKEMAAVKQLLRPKVTQPAVIQGKIVNAEMDGQTAADTHLFTDIKTDSNLFLYEIERATEYDGLNRMQCQNLSQQIAGGIRITSFTGFDEKRVVIPAEIDGKTVVSIGSAAFRNASIEEVIFPDSLKVIHREAFKGCEKLNLAFLPRGLMALGEVCFAETALTEVNIPSCVLEIPNSCFSFCRKLKKVTLGECVQRIGQHAFLACNELREVNLPDSLREIERSAFSAPKLEILVLPEHLQYVYSNSFDYRYSQLTCAFAGMDVEIKPVGAQQLCSLIFCLQGSTAQKYARDAGIPARPLSEFESFCRERIKEK